MCAFETYIINLNIKLCTVVFKSCLNNEMLCILIYHYLVVPYQHDEYSNINFIMLKSIGMIFLSNHKCLLLLYTNPIIIFYIDTF